MPLQPGLSIELSQPVCLQLLGLLDQKVLMRCGSGISKVCSREDALDCIHLLAYSPLRDSIYHSRFNRYRLRITT